jgi:peptidoglycan/xylan/chitin deacetylase (PgdA/CDA1 family)
MNSSSSPSIVARTLSPGGKRGRLLVFCFHRVLPEKDAFRKSEPDIIEFGQDIDLIANKFNVLPLSEAAGLAASGELPPAAACITFDDGYADNHALAAPVLEAAGLPATFFIATDAADEGVMWNDLVLDTLAKCGSDSRFDTLPLRVDQMLNEPINAAVGSRLLGSLKYLPPGERFDYAASFFTESTGERLPRLMMTRDQVSNLSCRGFEIGGHTMSHPILSTIGDAQAAAEIEGCREWLVDVTGRKPVTFAYPNGIPGQDFAPRHERMVRDAGFTTAVSTHWAAVKTGGNRLNIPRVGPWWRYGYGVRSGLARIYLSSYIR